MERVPVLRRRGAPRDPMTDDDQIRNYLHGVKTSLQVPRKQQRRVLEEIEAHIHDGAAEHIRSGVTRSEAIAQTIAELGPPEIVGAAFVEHNAPKSRSTGVRRWLPLVLPVTVLLMAVAGMVWTVTTGARHGWTLGSQVASWWYVRAGAIAALLVYAANFSIRRADRDPAWRRGAWACTGFVAAYLILDFASRLRLLVM